MTTPPPGYPAQPGYPGQPYAGQPYQHPYPTDPEDAPTPGISFGGALVNFFRKYARFTGRASLSEYWWMFLWNAILGFVLAIVMLIVLVPVIVQTATGIAAGTAGPPLTEAEANALIWSVLARLGGFWAVAVISFLIGLALIVPHLALTVRRLHDSNKSGHFAWLYLVPSVGQLIVLILCIMPSEPWGQRFDRPLAAAAPGGPPPGTV